MAKKPSSHETERAKLPSEASGLPVLCAYSKLEAVADLRPNPQNPKRHPQRQLEIYAKILRNGWRRPIVVSTRSGLIVKGHGAYEAARDVLHVELVPVDWQDYATEEAELADLLADNRLAELAENDEDALADLLGSLTGKIDLELAGIIAGIEGEEVTTVIKTLSVPLTPVMTWVLIGIPTVDYGGISREVERIARVPGTLVESTFQDATEEEEESADVEENG